MSPEGRQGQRAPCCVFFLEMLLKRHLVAKGHLADVKQRIPLMKLIEMAVEHLDLTRTLESGLEAIRERGNTAAHDPYGLTDEARAEDLPSLFAAVDDLVDDLHVKPKKWGWHNQELEMERRVISRFLRRPQQGSTPDYLRRSPATDDQRQERGG